MSFIKKDEKEEWILTVENAKMMNDWVQLINMCMIIKKTLEPVVETHTSPIVEPPKTEIVPAQLRNSRKLLNETPYEGTQ